MSKNKEVFNNIEEARAYLEEAPVLLEKANEGKKIAKIQLIVMILGLLLSFGGAALVVTFGDTANNTTGALMASMLVLPVLLGYASIIFSIIAYHKGGGFGKYMNTFKEIAKWGWLLIPIFPADIFVALTAIGFGLTVMLYFPLAFISMHVNSIRKNAAAAEAYIRRNQQAVAFA